MCELWLFFLFMSPCFNDYYKVEIIFLSVMSSTFCLFLKQCFKFLMCLLITKATLGDWQSSPVTFSVLSCEYLDEEFIIITVILL